jgi:hypothetical protein
MRCRALSLSCLGLLTRLLSCSAIYPTRCDHGGCDRRWREGVGGGGGGRGGGCGHVTVFTGGMRCKPCWLIGEGVYLQLISHCILYTTTTRGYTTTRTGAYPLSGTSLHFSTRGDRRNNTLHRLTHPLASCHPLKAQTALRQLSTQQAATMARQTQPQAHPARRSAKTRRRTNAECQ